MDILLCTIGFAGKTAEEFFDLLHGARVKTVIDIRLNRGGQLSGYAKYPDIRFFLDRVAGVGYSHEPSLAPTLEILRAYRDSGDWPAYEASFLALMNQRGVPGEVMPDLLPEGAALLCSEPGPEQCHRRLVAALLAEHWRKQNHSVEVRHLVSEIAVRPSRRRKKRGRDDRAGDQ